MNSHDVVRLFTNVPIKEVMAIIRKRVEEDKAIHKCTKFLPEDIMELLDFVLSITYFAYDSRIYKQIQHAPMGSLVSVVMSNLYTQDHEEKSMGSAPKEMKPKIWK